ncbi:MAG: hypothetical protein K2X39_05705, partial [Silvanigrellaceae bacterium]|nr:hypothetical protein [Silvanigrellaceae bacterium]
MVKPPLIDEAFERTGTVVKTSTVYGNKIDPSTMKSSELIVYARSFSHGCVVGEMFYESLLKANNVETLKKDWHAFSKNNQTNLDSKYSE